jgi:uncharacterized membrane protein (UPF0127 family)
MKFVRALLLLCLLFVAPSLHAQTIALKIGGKAVHAEVADTPEARNYGLMKRKKLCANCGMLFVFPHPDIQSFWMKNTLLPLSIAFIAADGSILNIEDMQPETTDTHESAGEVLYALEMPQGWFARRGVKPNDTVRGLKSVPHGQ